MRRAGILAMSDDLERRAGKGPDDEHPLNDGTVTDPSDYSDPRVAQAGEDPPDETAMKPVPEK
jgi:hypothetical protein